MSLFRPLNPFFLVKKANLEANLLISKPNHWNDFLLYKMNQSCHWYSFFRNCQNFSNSFLFLDGGKIFVNKNAIKLDFHHNCDFYFSGEFYGEFCLFFSEFWKIFSRSTVCVVWWLRDVRGVLLCSPVAAHGHRLHVDLLRVQKR